MERVVIAFTPLEGRGGGGHPSMSKGPFVSSNVEPVDIFLDVIENIGC